MKKVFGIGMLALGLAGCSSITQITGITSPTKTDDGETPIASITVQNVSYSLFGVLPIASGTTWKGECPYAVRPERNVTWFENRVTPEENLASLKAALKEVGSNKVVNLVEMSESWSSWSLWIVWQNFETTTCTVLK